MNLNLNSHLWLAVVMWTALDSKLFSGAEATLLGADSLLAERTVGRAPSSMRGPLPSLPGHHSPRVDPALLGNHPLLCMAALPSRGPGT